MLIYNFRLQETFEHNGIKSSLIPAITYIKCGYLIWGKNLFAQSKNEILQKCALICSTRHETKTSIQPHRNVEKLLELKQKPGILALKSRFLFIYPQLHK